MRKVVVAFVGLLFTAQAWPPALADPAPSGSGPVAPGGSGTPIRSPFVTGKPGPETKLWVPGEVVVEFEEQADPQERRAVHAEEDARLEERIEEFDVEVVDLPQGSSVAEAVESYEQDPLVENAEPNLLITPLQSTPGPDPFFRDQWGLRNTAQPHPITDSAAGTVLEARGTRDSDINAPQAWERQAGNQRTVVAVLDSGVDVGHADLAANIWVNPGERGALANNNRDDDDNGLIDDVNGWDFAGEDKRLLERNQGISEADHGTHVAGIIAAERKNSQAIAGVCPGCRIMVLKFMRPRDTDGDGTADTMMGNLRDELEALAYARRERADILNASFSTPVYSSLERNAYARLGRAGVLAVVAAGNDSLDNDMALARDLDRDGRPDVFSPSYPASYTLPNIVSVAASNHKDQYGYQTECARRLSRSTCAFTNWGHDSVDVAAPGVDIMSTVPIEDPKVFDGTSMAAPHVSGIAGLVESKSGRASPRQLKNAIMRSVERPRSLKLYAFRNRGQSGSFTRTQGRVNAVRALRTRLSGNTTRRTDGNIEGAKRIVSSRRGSVGWPADVNDVYRRRLRKGAYRVVLNGPARRNLDLYVWRPGTREIWQFQGKLRRSSVSRDGDEAVRFRVRRRGVYYLHVSSFFARGRYRLSIRRL